MNIYEGPGELVFNGALLMAQQENGQILYSMAQQKLDVAQAMHGRVASQLGNTVGRLTVTPFDNWSALPVLFPPYIGASVGAGVTGRAFPGVRPHDQTINATPAVVAAGPFPATIWNPQGNQIVINRLAVTRHPDLHLGVGKALFGQAELMALPSLGALIGDANAFHTITEAGAAMPAAQFTMGDFVREQWLGSWGAVAGFVGMQAEDEWVISCAARYDELKVQEQTIAIKLASVEFMAKCRPYGPSWSQIDSAVLSNRILGIRFGNPGRQGAALDLVLTSQGSNKTITLKNCDAYGEGFEFGGARLSTGEVGFVNQMQFAAGLAQPLIVFSA